MNRFRWLLVFCMMSLSALASEKDDEALTTGDYVRVRAEPSLTAPQLGFLYKNLRVRVLEKSANTSMVDGKAYFWYRVRQDNTEGWCSGAFLDFNVPATVMDTYAAPAEMDWFFSRYGSSTSFQDNTFNADSFSVDEYRRLIAATHESGIGTSAPLVLKRTLYTYLHAHPDESKYLYLKKKLYSQEFLLDMLTAQQFDVLPMLPVDLAKQAFTAWFQSSPESGGNMRNTVLAQIPESDGALAQALAGIMLTGSPSDSDVRQDAAVVRLAVASNGLLLKYAHPSLRDDFETVMTAVQSKYSAVQWASDRLKADVRIRDVVRNRAIHQDAPPEGRLVVDKNAAAQPAELPPLADSRQTSAELSIRAPSKAENGGVVPVEVGIHPPLVSGDKLTLLVGSNRACDVRPAGNTMLDSFQTRFRMPGSSDINAVIVRKNGARVESTHHVDVTVAGVIPAVGNDDRAFKLNTRENAVFLLLQNPMGRSGYVNSVKFTLPDGSVLIDTTLWLAEYAFISIKGPNISGDPSVDIGIARP
jgi:predicted secreted protein